MADPENIKKFIEEELSSKRFEQPLRFLNTSLLEWVGEETGLETLKKITSDKSLLNSAVRGDLRIPKHLIEFVSLFLENAQEKKIFDPCLTPDSFFVRKKFSNFKGYLTNKGEYDLITNLLNIDPKKITLGELRKFQSPFEKNNDKYDFICSFPPFLPPFIGKFGNFVDVFFDSVNYLNKDGTIIFLLPKGRVESEDFRDRVYKEGVLIKGLFFLKQGVYIPRTQVESCLVVASKGVTEKTFVANLQSDVEVNEKVIYNNFCNSNDGKIIELGKYIDFEKFRSIKKLVLEKQFKDDSRKTGFKPIKLGEIAESIDFVTSKMEVEHVSNSIYFTRFDTLPVVIDPSDFEPNQDKYFRVVIKKTVNSKYLSYYLNNYPGNLSLEVSDDYSFHRTANRTIRKRTTSSLKGAELYLTSDLDEQNKIINANTRIENLLIKINELKSNLWDKPKKLNDTSDEITLFEKDESIEKWIKSLPFPLASILWKYHSNLDKEKKIFYLLKFFEALPQFMSLIILSCINNNKEFAAHNKDQWISKDIKFKKWYEKSDFGGWSNLFAYLSKFLRKMLNDPQERDFINDLLGSPSKHFVNFIIQKQVVNILDTVRDWRNKWDGHVGNKGDEKIINDKLHKLEQKLNEIRQNIKSSFESFKIISPGKNEYDQGIYTYEVKELIGTTTPFFETKIESLIALEKSKLYIIHADTMKPIEVLPFIKYNSKEKALYFYSSMESNGIRYISYHYEIQPEINQQMNEDFKNTLNLLISNEEKNT